MLKKIIYLLSFCSLIGIAAADEAGGFAGGGGLSGASDDAGVAGNAAGSSGGAGITVPSIISGGLGQQSTGDLGAQNSNAKSAQSGDDAGDIQDDKHGTTSLGGMNKVKSFQASATQDPFVRNVFIRTGLTLRKFGDNVFSSPDSFTPAQNIPVPDNYIVGPGDNLQIQSSGAVNSSLNTKIEPNGTIFIPKLGEVPVTGVSARELNGYLTKKIGKIYRNFNLSVNVTKVKSIQVTVAGMTNQPGTYTLSSLSTLSNAIMAVGGPSALGSMRNVELKRNGGVIAHFDLYRLLIDGDNSQDVRVLAGDVILFKPIGPEVAIYDGVKRQRIYEVKSGESIRDIVNFSGGYSSDAKTDKIIVETIGNNQAINVNNYTTTTALDMPVSEGEIIHFFRTNNKYENSVALVGNVINPTRIGYTNGMRVRDLIPNQEVLLTKSFYNSFSYNTYGRDNTLTQMEIEKTTNQSNAGGLNLTTGLSSSKNLSNAKPVFGVGQNLFIAGPVNVPEADINWNYALIVRLDPDSYNTHIIPFNLRKAIEGDPANNKLLKPGDVINVLSAKDVRTASAGSPLYVFIDGEVSSPGVYELQAGQSLKDVIESAGGVSSKAYLFGIELSRASVKEQQTIALNQMLDQAQQSILAQSATSFSSVANAGQAQMQQMSMQQQIAFINKMRDIKPSGRVVLSLASQKTKFSDLPDFILENGDTVYIPKIPDVINVVGQVYNPATFMYKPHFTVKDYINLAGTENEYANTSVEYVLRADGSLYSKRQSGWFGGFDSRSLNPGDVIIIPQQIQFGGAIQNLLNWTQILSNFGTAAAAITVFK